ncbi:TPA: hypothetical protein L9968_002916 [Klebsiella aerogenes]|uniref:Uncharacterized protein n=1 Tax=Klebsiella aerogenes TaxID=548 RepID=A0AAW9LKT4_KLEAE|nr:hypothetical protein [Klebsiella aerogenes]AWD02925.1 hypothetical protein AM407_07990 [Klebsiella aerogenes]EIV6643975.1 hypothetical protein [Klebsiella aerogenes]EKT3981376.1 hypothetical protein [Klebsiella aerogenes]EKU0352865.1 hypothetical protein [Klebsiella aerogenes]EKU6155444.1 hypothetical protein [Klebsiella aerogenes]
MRTLKVVIIAGVLGLAGCSSHSSPETVDTLNTLQVPVINNSAAAPESSTVVNYFQDNSLLISQLSQSLKSNYLQDVDKRDVFDKDSEAYQVYGALTKLEQMASMNDVYRKENNIAGLQEINKLLKTIPSLA